MSKKKVFFPNRDKKKVLISTWKDLDSFESEEEERKEVNLCLMANSSEYSLDNFDKEVDFSNLHSII